MSDTPPLPAGSWDCHTHLFRGADGTLSEAIEARKTLHASLGIDRAVIVQTSLQGRNHLEFAAAIAADPALRGVALIDDGTDDAMLDHLHASGIRGCRFQFVSFLKSQADPVVVRRTAERIRRLGWHMLVHVEGKDLIAHADLLRASTLPVVIDHLAHVRIAEGVDQPPFRLMRELLEGNDHIWVKLSSADRWSVEGPPAYSDAVPFGRALVETRPDRLIWASDWPHTQYKNPYATGEPPPDVRDLVKLLHAYVRGEADLRQILVANPQSLYGL